MDTFSNNGELPVDPVDPIDWRLEDQFLERYFQESLWQQEDAQWLQDVLCNNSAAAVSDGDIVQGDHQQATANVSAMQALRCEQVGGSTSAQKMIEIKVQWQEKLAKTKSRCNFLVDPTNKVSLLRVLLVNKNAQLPKGYLFAYRMTILNEDKSFLDQGMVCVEVPKLDVLDNIANNHRQGAANVYAMQTLSEIKIKVELWKRLSNKNSTRKFYVDPTNKVSVLRVLLVNTKIQLPDGYIFSYRMTVLNEDKSFLDQGMVGVGVPKVDVLDNVTNFSRH